MQILLVDDEAAIRRSLSRLLTSLGHEVRCASGFGEAMALAAAEAPDLVLSDVRMEGTSGIDLLQAMRARHPGVPIVLMTGYDGDSAALAVRHGARDFLRKPVTLRQVRECLQRFDRERTLADQIIDRGPQQPGLVPTPPPAVGVRVALDTLRTQVDRLQAHVDADVTSAVVSADAEAGVSRQICRDLRAGLAQLETALRDSAETPS